MREAPAWLDVAPIAHAAGVVALPGSKSISNRTLLLAALADGDTRLSGLLDADDIDRMQEALAALGIEVTGTPGTRDFVVHGQGGVIPVKAARLHLGNAGTAFRPLTAALALSGGRYELSGVARMHERPIGDLVDALNALGADIRYLGNPGFPPLAIEPGRVHAAGAPDRVTVRGDVSSQFTSALLMALPLVDRAWPRADRRHRGRTDLEALCRDHHPSHGALRRGRGAGRRGDRSACRPVPATRARARSTWKAMRRPRRTFSRPARSAGDRCASRGSGAARSRATSPSRTRWNEWARRSTAARTGSKRVRAPH